jgi:DNA mismatch repair ATPase MutS
VGGHPLEEATLLAAASTQDDTWLDERTVDDLELGSVFTSIDRTRTATGAQVLWRWLRAPTRSPAVLAQREAAIAQIDPARIADAIGSPPDTNGSLLPALLWQSPPPPFSGRVTAALLVALVASLIATMLWPPALFFAVLLFIANVFLDDWSKIRLANAGAAIKVLDGVLVRSIALAAAFPALGAPIRDDLRVRGKFRRRIALLHLQDPLGLADMIRAGLLVRVLVTRSCMQIVDAERERLRRIVEWFGEMDALTSIKILRSERDVHVPEIVEGPPALEARDLVHPAVPDCVANDVTLAASGLLITGSNMSGKSTFLRTIAINAVLAQSIHTTFGAWRSSPLYVRAVMRIEDVLEDGMSTYAVEVAAMHELVSDPRPCLFVIDEPFHGTNPAVRVPIIVAVLEYLVGRGLVVTATHDLDVAHQLDQRFARGYFEERDGDFDRTLRTGIAPVSNAIEILRRAGYPEAIMERLS